jgi:hypothetical protein
MGASTSLSWISLKRAALLQRLTSLLDLETPNAPPRMALWPGVLPVLDIEDSLAPRIMAHGTMDLTAASAGTVFVPALTVPVGERWRIWAIYRPAFHADAIGVFLCSKAPDAAVYTSTTPMINLGPASTSISYAKDFQYPILAEEGFLLGCWNTADAADSARKLYILYSKEDTYGVE